MGVLISITLFAFVVSGCGDPSDYENSIPTDTKTGKKFVVGRMFDQQKPAKDEEGEYPPHNIIEPVKAWRYKRKKSQEGNPESEEKVRDLEIVNFLKRFVGTQWHLAENRDVIDDITGINEGKIKHIENISYFDTTAIPEPNEVYYVHPNRLAENSAKVFVNEREEIQKLYREEYPSDFYFDREVNKNRKAMGAYDPITRLNWPEELEPGLKDPDGPGGTIMKKTREFDFSTEAANHRDLKPEFFKELQVLFTNLAQHIRNVEAQIVPYPDPPFKTKSTSSRATDLESNYNIESADKIKRLNLSQRKEFELFGRVPIEVDPGSMEALGIKYVKDMFFEIWNQINAAPGKERVPLDPKEETTGLKELRKKLRLDPKSGDGTQGALYGMKSEVMPKETEVIGAIRKFVDDLLDEVRVLQDQKQLIKKSEIDVPDIEGEEDEEPIEEETESDTEEETESGTEEETESDTDETEGESDTDEESGE
jgi:hypothetical protein